MGFFKNSSLDDITNPRLLALKQKTLPWSFTAVHQPGRDNKFPDAASRFPSSTDVDDTDASLSEILCNILGDDSDDETDELA